jgi:peptidoglycan/LPS O-acetylase OafA/YrhL
MLALCIVSFIATTPYFLFGRQIILYHLVAFVYNAGVNIYVYLFAATLNTKRLELSRGSSMNMQGVSYKNFLVMIPLLVIPISLISLFALFSATYIALIIIALMGLAGILFRDSLLSVIEKQFLRRKYALCTGFRKKE